MSFPTDRKYTDHDEWVKLDGDVVTLGITNFAQDALGELVYIELPDEGAPFEAGDAICEVESVKAVAEVFTPVAGTVIAVNDALDGAENTVNEDPHGEGWLVKLRAVDPVLDNCMDAAAYSAKVSAT